MVGAKFKSPPKKNYQKSFDGNEELGYRLLGILPDSPASNAGLVSFFDFLIGIHGEPIFSVSGKDKDNYEWEWLEDEKSVENIYGDEDISQIFKDSYGITVELLVWNIKSKTQRKVKLTPLSYFEETYGLGVKLIKYNYAQAGEEEQFLRILNVDGSSPADIAGLSARNDYILCTTILPFLSEKNLRDFFTSAMNRTLQVYVYNTESDSVRVVTIMCAPHYTASGLLGAEVGNECLDCFPVKCLGSPGKHDFGEEGFWC